MAEVQTLPTSKPDIQIRLTWGEAVELRDTLGSHFGNDDLYTKIRVLLED